MNTLPRQATFKDVLYYAALLAVALGVMEYLLG